ncbi:hypothetical protein N7533_001000 [Penicillium manginii]|jgi:hypothetical protein|uniref:uncharacterized protein n=1 Tax=Penicillium manginii TaxID=203109 RepID=UPI0025471725|nr:uncharacterized protein N7533_001000 [Penicillium manginii]KAJ5768417.1 hypothetical protein N7533_001000 [Penicillium manginii]
MDPRDENQHLFSLPTTVAEGHHPKQRCGSPSISGERFVFSITFILLLIPLSLSILLLYSDAHKWLLPGNMYNFVNQYRSSVQTAVQVISATLAAIEVFALCRLINLATRIHLKRAPVSLNMLSFWSALSTSTANWSLPFWMIVVTLLVGNLHTALTAVWTGALTPVNTLSTQNTTIQLPHWSNNSLVKEYPSQIDQTGPSARNIKGYFTYSVGLGLLGSLLGSANSASSTDSSIRNHNKLDNTRYNFHGRSYGAGSSAGLTDQSVHNIPHAINYTYSEMALAPSVSCIYNSSSEYAIVQQSEDNVYAAYGYLPDSASREWSDYVGFGADAIVAVAVSHSPTTWSTMRYLAIAAGRYYKNLDMIQCAVSFTTTRFNVSVNISERNITIHNMTVSGHSENSIPDIDPHGNITHVVMRQLALISADQTNFYRSTVGDVFNASIGDYRTSVTNNATTERSISDSQIALKGVENAVISLVDDILVAYASAQLMVSGLTASAPALVHAEAIRVGSRAYIIVISVITIVIVILVAVEAVRMRGWRALPAFDYTDTRMLVVATSRGGNGIAEHVDREGDPDWGCVPILWSGWALHDHGSISVGTLRKEPEALFPVI